MLKRFVPFCVFAMMVLCALWAPRQASGIIVHVQVHWSGQLSDYNIGADSIIQIIVYNKAYDPPGSTVEDNFDRGRSGAYLLSSTPEGHEIIYEEALKETDRWFDIDVPYVVKNQYYTYVRIISREDDQDREYYWGITQPSKVNGTYNIHKFTLVNHDEFVPGKFEVIPEPPPFALIAAGLGVCWLWRRGRFRGRGKAKAKPEPSS